MGQLVATLNLQGQRKLANEIKQEMDKIDAALSQRMPFLKEMKGQQVKRIIDKDKDPVLAIAYETLKKLKLKFDKLMGYKDVGKK